MTAKPADRLLLGALRHSAPRASAVLLLTTGGAAIGLALPAVLGHTLDLVLLNRPAQTWLFACAVLTVLLVLLGALDGLLTGTTDARATAWLRRRALGGVLAAGPTATERHETGDLVARIVGNAATAGTAPTALAATAATALTPVGALIGLALIDLWTAAAFVVGLPLLAWLMRAFVRDTGDSVAQYQRIQGDIAGRLLEAVGGARTIAAAGSHEREAARILKPLPALSRQGHRMWRVQGRSAAQAAALVPLLQIAVLAVGGLRLLTGALTVGDLLAASRYAVLAAGVGMLVGHLNGLVHSRAAARRLTELQDLPAIEYGDRETTGADAPAEADADPAAGAEGGAKACTGALELRGITVRKAGHLVLDGLDLTVPGGCTMAVVGRSGTGKSVLAAVAGRLTEPDEGEVLLDGEPLRRLSHYALRRSIGYAFERPALLGDTVHDTVAYGVYEPGPGDVEAAAHAAGAASFIRRLPEGYATPCAEVPLSGGEVQRLGLARAFAHAERLLILDDATSSLDTVTELRVGRALLRDVRAGTRLIIAHRAATAARADLVAWLDAGVIRALAPHAVLWEDPRYRALFAAEEAVPLAEEAVPSGQGTTRPVGEPVPPAGDGRWKVPLAEPEAVDRTTARLPVRKRQPGGPAIGGPGAGRPRRAIGHGGLSGGEREAVGAQRYGAEGATPGGPSAESRPTGVRRAGRSADEDFPGRGARRTGGPAGARPAAPDRPEGLTPVQAQWPPPAPAAATVPSWANGSRPAPGRASAADRASAVEGQPTQEGRPAEGRPVQESRLTAEGRPVPGRGPVPGSWPVPEGIPVPEGMPVTQRRRRALADLLAQTEAPSRGRMPAGEAPRAASVERVARLGGAERTAGPAASERAAEPGPAGEATGLSAAGPATPAVEADASVGSRPSVNRPATPAVEANAPAAPGPSADRPATPDPSANDQAVPAPSGGGQATPAPSAPHQALPASAAGPAPVTPGSPVTGPVVPGGPGRGLPQVGGPEMTAARVVALGQRWSVERRGER